MSATTKPVRVQLLRKKGWKLPPNTVSVARPFAFGNPWRIGMLGVPDAKEAVRRFRRMVSRPQGQLRAGKRFMFTRESIRFYLGGKNLACWCPPDKPCHADVLLEIANRGDA